MSLSMISCMWLHLITILNNRLMRRVARLRKRTVARWTHQYNKPIFMRTMNMRAAHLIHPNIYHPKNHWIVFLTLFHRNMYNHHWKLFLKKVLSCFGNIRRNWGKFLFNEHDSFHHGIWNQRHPVILISLNTPPSVQRPDL